MAIPFIIPRFVDASSTLTTNAMGHSLTGQLFLCALSLQMHADFFKACYKFYCHNNSEVKISTGLTRLILMQRLMHFDDGDAECNDVSYVASVSRVLLCA